MFLALNGFVWTLFFLHEDKDHIRSLVELREGGEDVEQKYKNLTSNSLDGFADDPAVRVCKKQATDFVFDTRESLPNELRDLSNVVGRANLAKRAWDTSYNVLREGTMAWIRRKRVGCLFSDNSCQPVDFTKLDAEMKCHLHYVRAQALAIATNIVMQNVSRPYPATPEGGDKKQRSSNLSLLMLTKSVPWNFRRRKNARETWLSLAQSNLDSKKLHFHGSKPFHWKMAQKEDLVWSHRFVLGLALDRSDGPIITRVVFKEQRYYRDILLYPGVEDTAKTSWKVMWELAYVTKHQMFEYLLLLEDDSFARFDLVAQYLSANHHDKSVLYSGCLSSESRRKPKQGGSQKLPSSSVSALSFVNGAGMFLSKRVVYHLLLQARSLSRMQWDPNDDVFISTLSQKAGIHQQSLSSVHLLPVHQARVDLFDCRSSDQHIEFTMIRKNLPRKTFFRMTSGKGSLKFCPGIRNKEIARRRRKPSPKAVGILVLGCYAFIFIALWCALRT